VESRGLSPSATLEYKEATKGEFFFRRATASVLDPVMTRTRCVPTGTGEYESGVSSERELIALILVGLHSSPSLGRLGLLLRKQAIDQELVKKFSG
jgi:hypothetical protein